MVTPLTLNGLRGELGPGEFLGAGFMGPGTEPGGPCSPEPILAVMVMPNRLARLLNRQGSVLMLEDPELGEVVYRLHGVRELSAVERARCQTHPLPDALRGHSVLVCRKLEVIAERTLITLTTE